MDEYFFKSSIINYEAKSGRNDARKNLYNSKVSCSPIQNDVKQEGMVC